MDESALLYYCLSADRYKWIDSGTFELLKIREVTNIPNPEDVRMKRKEPNQRQLSLWQDEIRRNGTKRIMARHLLRAFGIERRSLAAIERVTKWLESQSPAIYAPELLYARALNQTLSLSFDKTLRIGFLADSERILMERFEADIMPKIKLRNPRMNFRPDGTRDELDFLCDDKNGRSVVVEIKKDGGDKRVVEQVLRYIQHIRSMPDCVEPRGIIITGQEDQHTRKALMELSPSYRIDWFIYGIDGENNIRIEPVLI